MSIRVLVADDQALVRGGFRAILEQEPDIEIAGEAGDGAEAIELARRHKIDVALMDIRMPRVDGIEATRRLTSDARGTTRVLILTTFDLDRYVYEALRAGASGFLLKDVEPEHLAPAVRTVASGEALLAPTITRRLIEEFVRAGAPSDDLGLIRELTAREREVLIQVAHGSSNAEVAAHLSLSEATVKTHVAHILAKLQVRDRVQAVVLAYEIGLVRPGRPESAATTEAADDGHREPFAGGSRR